jgi:hypothetical protein
VRVRRNERGDPHGPRTEPCADNREEIGEASVGERIGQPLSSESDKSQGADAVSLEEGNTYGHVCASARSTLRGLDPSARSLAGRGGPRREGDERRTDPRGTRNADVTTRP